MNEGSTACQTAIRPDSQHPVRQVCSCLRKFMGHADESSNSWQGLQLNPGEYAVVPLSGGNGTEENVKIEADKVSIVRVQNRLLVAMSFEEVICEA